MLRAFICTGVITESFTAYNSFTAIPAALCDMIRFGAYGKRIISEQLRVFGDIGTDGGYDILRPCKISGKPLGDTAVICIDIKSRKIHIVLTSGGRVYIYARRLVCIDGAEPVASVAVFPRIGIGIERRRDYLRERVLCELEHRALVYDHEIDILAV